LERPEQPVPLDRKVPPEQPGRRAKLVLLVRKVRLVLKAPPGPTAPTGQPALKVRPERESESMPSEP